MRNRSYIECSAKWTKKPQKLNRFTSNEQYPSTMSLPKREKNLLLEYIWMLIGYCFTPYRQYFSQITAAMLECIKHYSKYNFIQQVLTKQKKKIISATVRIARSGIQCIINNSCIVFLFFSLYKDPGFYEICTSWLQWIMKRFNHIFSNC